MDAGNTSNSVVKVLVAINLDRNVEADIPNPINKRDNPVVANKRISLFNNGNIIAVRFVSKILICCAFNAKDACAHSRSCASKILDAS